MKAYIKLRRPAAGLAAALSLILLAGCASHPAAPVEDRVQTTLKAPVADVEANFHVVQKGETLNRIAAAQKLSAKDLVAWNGITDPNKVEVGQRLRLTPPGDAPAETPVAEVRPVVPAVVVEARPIGPQAAVPASPGGNTEVLKREPRGGKLPYSEQALAKARGVEELPKPDVKAEPKPPVPEPPKPDPKSEPKPPAKSAIDWSWPVSGKILKTFDGSTSKGVDIAGKLGDPVLAAAVGKVVYVGPGFPGYGNLVIIKHDALFLSAYANNSQILVKEGQSVTKGQKIAKIGKSAGGESLLHFEIRRESKPSDPLKFLPTRE